MTIKKIVFWNTNVCNLQIQQIFAVNLSLIFMKKTLLVFLFFNLLLLACKSDEDEVLPVISISQPSENQTFNVLDTILIVAKVSDETKLESITVFLADLDFKPIMKAYTIPVKANAQDIAVEYELDDHLLPGGNYNIAIEASDGYNVKHKYQTIHINGIEKKLLHVLFAGESRGNWDCISMDDSGNIAIKNTYNFDFQYFNFISPYNQLLVYNPLLKELVSTDFTSGVKNWTIGLDNIPGEPALTYSKFLNNLLFVSTFQGKTHQYNYQGTKKKTVILNDGYYISFIDKVGDFYVSIEKSRSNAKPRLSVYYASTFALKQSYVLDFEAKEYVELNQDEIIVIGNNANKGKVSTYTLSSNSLKTFVQTQFSPALQIEKFNSNFFYVSDSTSVYLYQYNPLSFYKQLIDVYPIDIYVDKDLQRLYVLTKNQLITYDKLSSNPASIITLQQNCKAFCFRYTI